jgi:hypothetical protein
MNTTTKTKPTAKSPAQQRRDDMLTVIAAKHLSRETLETRNSDSMDFSDQAVWSLKAALEAAYEAGAQAAIAATAGRR